MAASLSSAALSMSSLSLSSASQLPSTSSQLQLKSSFLCGPLRSRSASSSASFGKLVVKRRPLFCTPVATSSYMADHELSPDEIKKAYEELFGPAFSRLKKSGDEEGGFGRRKERSVRDNMEEKVVQIRRVTKVVKGGKQLSFRAIVIVGDKNGRVGVGVGKAKEVINAVQKSSADARRHLVTVPLTKQKTFPHRAEAKYGAAKVMLRPAALGTGVIAGGSVRTMLELAGVVNGMGKELGSKNPLNNARAVVEAVTSMKTFKEVSEKRGIPMEVLWQ
ncbi:hypothetical protein GOP47_0005381 [Adiantum capillus-veneris]|uniref:Small ribosomal subunit protein uS5c n=1 Tax=Adiantum capillus-veneris TaxID=13818 RepID=A0A9D4V6M5_ADICA|nr:hypothetical protein GOP47_0005381 [Adiantum capillus-veneris]